MTARPFAVITGASSGIGLELARCAVEDGCDVLIAADEASIERAADELRGSGTNVAFVIADLGTSDGVATLFQAVGDRKIDYMMANAGRGLGHAFLEQDWSEIESVLRMNVAGTTELLHRTARHMAPRRSGRILITGSVAGFMPGSFQAVYNGTKAYLDLLSWAIRNELADCGVSVTCLMPGPTETQFFERAHIEDTPVGESDKADAAQVARAGYDAMKDGKAGITPGMMNKVQSSLAKMMPPAATAWLHRQMAQPKEKT
jgi:uncharacterized protein